MHTPLENNHCYLCQNKLEYLRFYYFSVKQDTSDSLNQNTIFILTPVFQGPEGIRNELDLVTNQFLVTIIYSGVHLPDDLCLTMTIWYMYPTLLKGARKIFRVTCDRKKSLVPGIFFDCYETLILEAVWEKKDLSKIIDSHRNISYKPLFTNCYILTNVNMTNNLLNEMPRP